MRYVIARKEQKCKYCKKAIAKDEICIQGGKYFYHKSCHFKNWLWLKQEPNMTETVRRKQILDWYLEEQLKQK